MSSVKWRPFCLGLNGLNQIDFQNKYLMAYQPHLYATAKVGEFVKAILIDFSEAVRTMNQQNFGQTVPL